MLNIHSLSHYYRRQKPVINRVTTRLEAGRIAGLMGANGVGKSTLMRIVMGLLYPKDGLVEVLGHDPAKREVNFLNQIYLVPEETYLPDMTSDIFAALYSPFYPKFDNALFLQTLERFELAHPHALADYSFGQKKKFLIAFGVATRAKLLVLDEPTNGLDIPSKAQFRQLLIESISDDQSVLISTHQARDLENLIDMVILMDNQEAQACDLNEVANKLSIGKYEQEPADTIFSQKNIGEYVCLTPYRENSRQHLDLEMLFNAFHSNKEKLLNAIGAAA